MKKKPKILVIRGGAIGDFILTLPVFSALKEQFPDATLEVLGYPNVARLALLGGVVANVESIEAGSLAGFFARGGDLSPKLMEYFAGFGLIISYLYDPDEVFRSNIARASKAQFIQGPHRPDERESLHATEVFLKPLEKLAIFEPDSIPRITVEKAFETTAQSGRWIALHPGSGSLAKNWPLEKWELLLRNLVKSSSLYFLLIGGEAERGNVELLARQLPANRIKLMQNRPLDELARWIASCVGFIGHDSGISHLAAAVKVPSLILWGNSAETIWRPRGEVMTVLRDSRGLVELDPEVVAIHLDQLLNRSLS